MSSHHSHPPRILVVEDNADALLCTVRTLQKAGYLTCEATTASQALDSVRALRPDLVLLDVNLPDMDGREVCHRIKSDPELAMIFVVMLSAALVSSTDQVEGLVKGADGYLTRPIENQEFLARVASMLRIQQAEQQLRERTTALEAANRELTNARRVALEMTEEATTAREQALRTTANLEREMAERLHQEAALRKSEERFRSLFESAPVPIWEEEKMSL